jgi:PAS domain S-box-containing protein
MYDFLAHLLDTSGFPARWHCGNWTPGHGWLHIVSDLGVWSAYLAIPCVLGFFVLRRRDIPFRSMFLLFGAFILACGTTHLMEAIIFWWPAYRLAGLIKLFTAVVSWGTVVALVPVVPKVLAMRSPDELEREIAAHQKTASALRQAIIVLEQQVEALRASEERFRLVVDGTKNDAIFMLDPSGRVASWNAGAERVKKYRSEDILGREFSSFYLPEDRTNAKPEADLAAAAELGRYEEEGWRKRGDGTSFWANVVLSALRDDNKNLRGFSLITMDMTERKQADENVRRLVHEQEARHAAQQYAQVIDRQREQLRVTLNSIADGVITADSLGQVTLVNPVAEALTGWKSADVIGQPLSSVLHIVSEMTREMIEDPVAELLPTGPTPGLVNSKVLIDSSGAERPIDGSASLIKNEHGETVGAVIVFRDVTEKRAAESALRSSEERWRTLAEAVPNLVWTDPPDGQCDWLSSQWGKYTGIPEHELLGLKWLETVVHPDDRERTRITWEAACADQGDYDLEYRIRRYDGEYHWFRTRGVPVRDEHGKIVYWFGTCTDIEDYKRLEAALREADRRKNEFLAILAHELRNPLAPISNGLQVLRLSNDRTTIDHAREMMERQLGQLVRLVDDLLDLSRISRNKLELRKSRITLSSVIENAIETARPLIDSKRHTLTVMLPHEPVHLDADLTRLAQVFGNLLNNSAKYTDQAGHIAVRAQQNGGTVRVTVEDNGIGIPPDHQSRLFEIFSQVDHGIERSQGGLGIGLALVKGLVEMHGGSVESHSDGLGTGSKFTVHLPIAEPPSGPGPRSRPESAPPQHRRRILVVDDNRDAATSLVMMLSLLGHDVRVAYDGAEAIETAEAFMPDLVLLDIGLPKLNGYDACRRIRNQTWGHNMVIVAATGWGQDDDRRRTHEAGFNHHMVKPLDIDTLIKIIAAIEPRG